MDNIILIGMPGCGKTTLARATGEALGLAWYDCDALIEEKAGMSIAEVFATWGESAFRTMETAALIALCKREHCVIATGGGCVTREENYDILHESGKVLWLLRDLDKLPTEGRPISENTDIRALYAEREPLYRRFADASVDNNDTIESGLDAPRSCQFVSGGVVPLNEWTHVALTFDGSKLTIYVNGIEKDSALTDLVPANGVVLLKQNPAVANTFPSSGCTYAPCAFIVGARPKKLRKEDDWAPYALYPYYIRDGEHMESFENMQDYFQGYVDEVRVWDGARTGDQIREAMGRSIGFAEAAENRNAVFDAWYRGATRNNNDGMPNLPAELVLNYDFSTLPGAADQGDVAKAPAGFTKNVLLAAMSDYSSNPDIVADGLYPNLLDLKGGAGDGSMAGDLLVGWWNDCEVRSTAPPSMSGRWLTVFLIHGTTW